MKLIKNFLMDKPNQQESDEGSTGAKKKKIKVRKVKSMQKAQDLGYSSSDEAFIPLASRDSKWVDLAFYNPNFENQQEEDDSEEEELQIVNVDGNAKPPLLILFPGLSEKENASVASNIGQVGSTSDITKLLVGQKADFSRMRSSRKLFSNDTKLSSVQEIVQEEQESATSSLNSYLFPVEALSSSKSIQEHHESQESIPDYSSRKVKFKKRRRMPEAHLDVDYGSSSSIVRMLRRKPPLRPRQRGNSTIVRKDNELKAKSSNGSLGDDEHS
ncbi:hypothetical protein Trydic_g20172 [Trypoxylus dichotomus]